MIAIVGNAGNISASSPVTVTRTTTAGSLLVALCSRTSATDFFTGVTDSAGNTWSLATATPTSGGVGRRVELWYCANAAATTTVSATFLGTAPAAVTVHELSGAATTNVLDAVFGKFQASTTTPTSAQVTPTQANDFVIGFIRANSGVAQTYTLTSSPGYTAINVPIAEHHAIAYINSPAVGVATGPTWTLGSSAGNASITAAFKVAPAVIPTGDVKTWNGTQWVNANASHPVKYWNGSTWVQPPAGKVKYWDGDSWEAVL